MQTHLAVLVYLYRVSLWYIYEWGNKNIKSLRHCAYLHFQRFMALILKVGMSDKMHVCEYESPLMINWSRKIQIVVHGLKLQPPLQTLHNLYGLKLLNILI